MAVEAPDLISPARRVLEYDNRGALIWSFGKKFNIATAPNSPEPHTRALANKAFEAGQLLRSTSPLNIFVENRFGGRHPLSRWDLVIRLNRYCAVDGVHNGRDQRFVAVAMAGPAGHDLAPSKVAFVDVRNHE